MPKLFNNVGEQTTTTGTGTITLTGDIDESYATFAEAGAVDGNVITYKLSEGDDFEIGRGTIGGTVTTLSRDTVLISKIGGTVGTTKMTLGGAAEVRVVMAAEDRIEPPASSTDNAIVRWDGAGGSAVQNSTWTLSDVGVLTGTHEDASTDTSLSVLNLQRTSSGTPDAGIGAEISLNVETAVGNIETGAAIRTICWGADSGNEEFQLVLRAMTQGVLHDMFYVANWSGAFGRVSFDFPHTNIGFDLSTNGVSNWFIGCDQTLGGTGADFGISNGSLSFVKSLLVQGDTNNVCIGGGIIPPRQLTVFSDPAATNTVTPLIQLRQGSSGTPATGIGTSIEFAVETAADNFETGATIEAVTTNVGSGTEGFDLVTKIMAAGATAAEKFRVKSDGRYVTQGGHDEIVVSLTDGATVALNAALGNVFHLTAGGNRTISVPTNAPAAGRTQKIIIRHQASGAGRTLTLTTGSAGAFRFGTDITALSATTSGLTDYIGCVWNQAADRWDVVSYVKGF